MLIYRGGTDVTRGHYWAPTDGSWIDGRCDHRLPGEPTTVYLRLHPVAMALLGPVIGLVFFLTLPVTTVVLGVSAILTRIARQVCCAVGTVAYFEWRPDEAYLGGKRKKCWGPDNNDSN
jgi:hypothetical protein